MNNLALACFSLLFRCKTTFLCNASKDKSNLILKQWLLEDVPTPLFTLKGNRSLCLMSLFKSFWGKLKPRLSSRLHTSEEYFRRCQMSTFCETHRDSNSHSSHIDCWRGLKCLKIIFQNHIDLSNLTKL